MFLCWSLSLSLSCWCFFLSYYFFWSFLGRSRVALGSFQTIYNLMYSYSCSTCTVSSSSRSSSSSNMQQQAAKTQHAAISKQEAARSKQHAACSKQEAAKLSMQQSACGKQHAACSKHQAARSMQDALSSMQHALSSKQHAYKMSKQSSQTWCSIGILWFFAKRHCNHISSSSETQAKHRNRHQESLEARNVFNRGGPWGRAPANRSCLNKSVRENRNKNLCFWPCKILLCLNAVFHAEDVRSALLMWDRRVGLMCD